MCPSGFAISVRGCEDSAIFRRSAGQCQESSSAIRAYSLGVCQGHRSRASAPSRESRTPPETRYIVVGGLQPAGISISVGGFSPIIHLRRWVLLAMLDAVYVDAKEERRIVGIKPKPPFRPIFQVAATKEGSGVLLMKEPPASQPEARCLWWRRGRVELPVQRKLPDGLYRLSWLFFLPPGWKPTPLLGDQPCFSLVPLTGVGDTAPQLSAPLPSP